MDAEPKPPAAARPSRRLVWSLSVGLCVGLASGTVARRCAVDDPDKRFGQRTLQHRPVVAIDAEELLRDMASAHAERPFDPPELASATRASSTPSAEERTLIDAAPREGGAREATAKAQAPARDVVTPTRSRGRGASVAAARHKSADAEWAAQFGDSGFTRTARPRPLGGAESSGKANGSLVGTTLAVRLQTEIASSPKGAPVVAVLQRPVRLGRTAVPKGSELYGATSGQAAGRGRVTIEFTAVRLPSGDTLATRGVAVDLEGRLGVVGKVVRGASAVESIGSSAASRAARVFGLGLARGVGGAIGAGLAGATDAASSEVQALKQAPESVVVVARGTAFQVVLDGRR